MSDHATYQTNPETGVISVTFSCDTDCPCRQSGRRRRVKKSTPINRAVTVRAGNPMGLAKLLRDVRA